MAINDTTADLPQVGSDIGGFMSGLAPGLVDFLFNLGIAVGVIGLFGAVIYLAKRWANTHNLK